MYTLSDLEWAVDSVQGRVAWRIFSISFSQSFSMLLTGVLWRWDLGMPECVWCVSLLIWHIVCSLWFTAQPGNVRQQQALATEGETGGKKKSWPVNMASDALMVSDANTAMLVNYTIWLKDFHIHVHICIYRVPQGLTINCFVNQRKVTCWRPTYICKPDPEIWLVDRTSKNVNSITGLDFMLMFKWLA